MWIAARKLDDIQRQLEELRNRCLAAETKLARVEDQMTVWPITMEELGEKARTAIRRLAKRVADAQRVDEEPTDAPGVDPITARIRARRAKGA